MNSAPKLKRAIFREGGPSDRDAIWTVFLTSVLELCGTHYDREEVLGWARSLSPESFAASPGGVLTLVAEEDGHIVAFGQFDPADCEIAALYVAPGHTGRGIGRTLLKSFEAAALEKGIGWMQTGSTLNAVGFFEKEGYKQAKMEQLRLPDGTSIPLIRMSKSFPEKK